MSYLNKFWIIWDYTVPGGHKGWAIGYSGDKGKKILEEWYKNRAEALVSLRKLNNDGIDESEEEEDIYGWRKHAVECLLDSIGEDPAREGLLETPMRVSKMYDEIFDGYSMDPKTILSKTFKDDQHKEMVIVRNIDFYSHCEHHMVPFFGKVHIGYVPEGTLVGISKFVRLVECFAHRLQIQERMTSQIADAIVDHLNPMGAIVVIEAEHLCMKMRGVKNPCADTVTSAVRGVFSTVPAARSEFLTLMRSAKE